MSTDGFWNLLGGGERAVLLTLGPTKDFPPGTAMCFQGEPATHVFVLMSGWVKILSVTSGGQEMVRALRGHGDIVGEVAGQTTGHRNSTIRAIDRVRALIVLYDRFSAFLDAYPAAAQAYRKVVTQRWNDAEDMLRRQPVTTGAQRLAMVLLDLADRHGTRTDNGAVEVAMPLSQQELASLALTSRATVTRALHSWRQRGYIRTGQRHITITDLQGLRHAAGHPD
jgi:CRP/FNR family transcriptional regulator, cyclic AMP receptor protein